MTMSDLLSANRSYLKGLTTHRSKGMTFRRRCVACGRVTRHDLETGACVEESHGHVPTL
jgi:hypothetical protein